MKYKFILFCFITFSCSNISSDQKQSEKGNYFDLTSLLNPLIDQLEEQNPQVKKHIQFDSNSEKSILKNINWKKELELFIDADINKPNLIGGYSINESSNNGINKISFQALNSDYKTQLLEVIKEKEIVIEIVIKIKESNELFANERIMKLYIENKKLIRYNITGMQKIAFYSPINYSINSFIL